MKVELKDGYIVEVDENVQNDWSFLAKLRKIDKGEAGLIVDVAEILLGGEDEVERLAKHLEVDGRTPLDTMVDALTEVMEAVNELKNSSPSPT